MQKIPVITNTIPISNFSPWLKGNKNFREKHRQYNAIKRLKMDS